MNSAIQSAIAAVEAELEALDEGYSREHGELESTLAHLQRIGDKQDGTPSPSGTRKYAKRRGNKPGPKTRAAKTTRKKAVRKTDGRTDGRSKAHAGSSEPP